MKFTQLREKMLKPTSPKMKLQMAISIALDMGGNMTGAYKKIEKIEKGLGDHPAVKAALRFANEDVNEKMSKADKKKRLQMIARAVEKMKERELKMAKKDALAAIKALESVDVNESAIGDKLMKSQSVQKTLGGNPMKFHMVGKPVVIQGIVDGYHEDYVYYTDGKYVLAQAGHKQVGDARNVNPDDTFAVYMVDSTGTMSTAELKKFAMNDARQYMDKVVKVSDKVRDFSKEGEGQDIAPKQIRRVPFKESVQLDELKAFKDLYKGPPKKSLLLDDIRDMNKRWKNTKTKEGPYGGINDITIRFSAPPTGNVIEPDPRFKSIYPDGELEDDVKLGIKHAKEMLKVAERLSSREPFKSAFPKPTMIEDPIQIYIGHQYTGDYNKNPKYKVDITPIVEEIAKLSFRKMPMANARMKDLSGFYGGVNESVNESRHDAREKALNLKLKELEYKMKLKDFMRDVVDAKLPKKNEEKPAPAKKPEGPTEMKITDTSSSTFNKLSTIAKDIGVEISREENHILVKGDAKKMADFKSQMNSVMKESKEIKEGTWQIPDSYPQLVALQKFLKTPHKAKTAKEVHKFHIDVDRYFGDDSFSDMLDAYYATLPGGDIDPYDKKPMDDDLLARYRKGNTIKKGTDLNIVLMKALTDWTGGDMKFKGNKIVQMPRDWYEKDNPKMNKSSTVKAKLERKRPRGNIRYKRQDTIMAQVSEDKLTFNELIEARFGRTMKRSELLRKFGKEMKDAIRKGTLELSTKAEEELIKYVMDNYPEEIPHDDPDIWIDWLDDNLEDFVKGKGYK